MPKLSEIITWLGDTAVISDTAATSGVKKDPTLTNIKSLQTAAEKSLSFLSMPEHTSAANKQLMSTFAATRASAILVQADTKLQSRPANSLLIEVNDVNSALNICLDKFYPPVSHPPQIAKSAIIAQDTELHSSVHIGELVSIGSGVKIGKNSVICAGCVIGDNVTIGDCSILHPRVVIYRDCEIGDRVILHAGVTIGSDGFGFRLQKNKYIKRRHVGKVIIESEVEIGANSCIDRATLATTKIGYGSKIDNLVQIAHNVQIGKHVIICAQSGVAGSSTLSDYSVMAGMTGIKDNINVAPRTIVNAGNLLLRQTSDYDLIAVRDLKRKKRPKKSK